VKKARGHRFVFRTSTKAALQHGLHGGRDFWLTPPFSTTPGAQEDAVRDRRVLAEMTA
jgi:hypothetical protein